MDIGIFKGLAENARKVEWSKQATFNGRQVAVSDVDLNAKASLTSPMTATVSFVDGTALHTMGGVFWPRDMRAESVELDGVEQPNGKVSLAGKYSFPASVKIKLRFRYGTDSEFLVTGKAGLGLLGMFMK